MIKIPTSNLIDILELQPHDFCMLIPLLKKADTYSNIECYVSQKDPTDFICYIEDECGNQTLDILWKQEKHTEILKQLVLMNREKPFPKDCAVTLYKNYNLINSISKLFQIENMSFIIHDSI